MCLKAMSLVHDLHFYILVYARCSVKTMLMEQCAISLYWRTCFYLIGEKYVAYHIVHTAQFI